MGKSEILFENSKLDVIIRHSSGGSHVPLAFSATHDFSCLLCREKKKIDEAPT